VLDPWYVTGFVDGEGSFTFSRNGRSLALYFAIKLTYRDLPVLRSLHSFFGGVGKIYLVRPPHTPGPKSGMTKTAYYYRITKIADLAVVVEHFDKYPLVGLKRESYQIWKRMYLLKRAFRKADSAELHGLANQLSAATPRNQQHG
jgi:hypothetical protein